MRVTFVGHSSLIIWLGSSGILCDPWLSGRVFNNGWGLSPEPVFDPAYLKDINHLWISHEHADHLHFATLKNFPQEFKSRVVVIFQKNNSDKVSASLRKIGYQNFLTVPHCKRVPVGSSGDWIAVYQHLHMDSALVVGAASGETVINVNDAELNEHDCKKLRARFGPFAATFRQFSIAGFDGILENSRARRRSILQTMLNQHRWLGADVTCPIASFMYFCRPDNEHLNALANTALDALKECQKHALACHLLFPGTTRDLLDLSRSAGDVAKFREFYANPQRSIDPLDPIVPISDIATKFSLRTSDWRKKFPAVLINRMGTIPIRIEDLGATYAFNFRNGSICETDQEPIMAINSQPLLFAFAMPFGIQTLGVSGRYRLKNLTTPWKFVRIVSSLYNSEIYLKPRYLLNRRFLAWLGKRLPDIIPTIRQQAIRFFPRQPSPASLESKAAE
ncbi:MAG TPA: MBL fold metallo-hydrolase [Candidatus Sulfotelmatobacter sp.]|nr:MBL fold metallo-hydrolase [Candidatus Sulfotelmatobacter sp.]